MLRRLRVHAKQDDEEINAEGGSNGGDQKEVEKRRTNCVLSAMIKKRKNIKNIKECAASWHRHGACISLIIA